MFAIKHTFIDVSAQYLVGAEVLKNVCLLTTQMYASISSKSQLINLINLINFINEFYEFYELILWMLFTIFFSIYNHYTATALMIHYLSITTTTDTVTVRWNKPEFLPESYHRTISCKHANEKNAYLQESINISSTKTEDIIPNLRPGSHCELRFFAVYNPASLDDGLSYMINTKEQGEKHMHAHTWMWRVLTQLKIYEYK